MDIFSFLTLFGGLAFFLYGMHVMSSGLEKMTGGRLEKALSRMTSNPFKGLLLGMGITVAIQSSSALTVMLVGLVNAGLMQFSQTAYMIMGSNIGTTLTAWILSLAGIDSDSVFINMLKPTSFAPIMALAGVILIMTSKKHRKRDIGNILVGFAVLMFGMSLMSDAMKPLASMPEFSNLLVAFQNPLLGVVVGTVFTGIIQSSAAAIGILQALSLTGQISVGVAVPIIMGGNIGTCVTALISSIGVNKNAKRVAILHTLFNILGTIFCLIVYYGIQLLGLRVALLNSTISPVGIAAAHSVFNLVTTAVLMPFSQKIVRFSAKLLPDGEDEMAQEVFIDERLLATPAFAISECGNVTSRMAKLAHDTIISAIAQTDKYDFAAAESIQQNEDRLDKYEDKLGSYLVKLSSKDLTEADSRVIAKLLRAIGDLERIGDHALNLSETGEEIYEKKIEFSSKAVEELKILKAALLEILERTTSAFVENDIALAGTVEPLEQLIDELILEVKANHVQRLQKGKCTIELGFVLSDILTNIERVSDHCSNIAVAVIEVAENNFDSHEYLNTIKTMDNEFFRDRYNGYKRKYKLN